MSIEGDRYPSGVFNPGESLTASSMNDLAGQAARGQQFYSSGQLVAQGTFGTVNLDRAATSLPSYFDYPFKVTVSPGDEPNDWKVYVRPGTANNFVPKIGTKYLDGPDTPYLLFNSVGSTGKKVVALRVTKSGATFFPNAVEVVLLDDTVVNTDNDGYLSLASITCVETAGVLTVTSVNQFVYASQMVARVKPTGATAVWSFTSR